MFFFSHFDEQSESIQQFISLQGNAAASLRSLTSTALNTNLLTTPCSLACVTLTHGARNNIYLPRAWGVCVCACGWVCVCGGILYLAAVEREHRYRLTNPRLTVGAEH